jgi:anti-sigma B factor antagonist
MEIEKTISDETVVLVVNGKLTAMSTDQLRSAIEQSMGEAKKLILDFKDMEYLASAGLRVLLNTQKKLADSGSEFVIRNVSKDIMGVFEVTGLDSILTFE